MVAFDKFLFKLFTLRFSNKLVRAPSCKRPKTTQRTLFLSFETKNCFPVTVLCRRLSKKSGKLHATWWIKTSLLVLCPYSKYRKKLSRYLKRFLMVSRFFPSFQISGRITIPMFQLSVWCEKCVAARHYADIGKQLSFANNRNRSRWAVLCLSQDGACIDLYENHSENNLKPDLSNDQPPIFSHWSIPPVLCSRVPGGPTIDQRFESYYNYCQIFNYILSADTPVDLELPNQWLWEIIDEFIYQFQAGLRLSSQLRMVSGLVTGSRFGFLLEKFGT